MSALLETCALSAFYGDFQALFGIDVTVAPGEVIALIGSNGAGKSTFLKSVSGLLRPRAAEQILYRGAPIGGAAATSIVGKGIALVPEGRRLFASLTVEENLSGQGAGTCTASMRCSRRCTSAAITRPPRCRAASSRWSR